jgi:hypothetical protein
MRINYEVLDEDDFYEKDFYPSSKNDHDEGVISYVKQFSNGRELVITLLPYGCDSSVTAEIVESGSVLASITHENVSSIAFQGWGNEQILRVYLNSTSNEFLIFHSPNPRLFYGELH